MTPEPLKILVWFFIIVPVGLWIANDASKRNNHKLWSWAVIFLPTVVPFWPLIILAYFFFRNEIPDEPQEHIDDEQV